MFLKGQGGKHRDALGGHRPPSAPTKGKLLGKWAAPSPLPRALDPIWHSCPLTVPLPPDMPWCPCHPAPRSGCPSSLQNPSLAPYHPPCNSPSPWPDKNSFWSPNGLSSCDFPAMASRQSHRKVTLSSSSAGLSLCSQNPSCPSHPHLVPSSQNCHPAFLISQVLLAAVKGRAHVS